MDRGDRVQGASVSTIGILLGRHVGLEDWFEDDHRRHLHYAITDRGNSQRSLLTVRLRNPYAPYGLRSMRFVPQFFRQFLEPSFLAVFLNVFECLSVHA